MILNELIVDGKVLMGATGQFDWGYVKNAPTINITDNNHTHDDRYYTKSEFDDRMALLDQMVNDLVTKIDNLFAEDE